jgi:predicted nucleic acid-binding protein
MKAVISDASAISNLLRTGRIETRAADLSIRAASFEHLDPGEVEGIKLAKGIGSDKLNSDDKEGRCVVKPEEIKWEFSTSCSR